MYASQSSTLADDTATSRTITAHNTNRSSSRVYARSVVGRRGTVQVRVQRGQVVRGADEGKCGKKYKRCHGAANDPKNIEHAVEWVHDELVRADMADFLIHSPLSQRISRDGTAVEIEIYEDGKGDCLLEIVDEFWNSTILDESFATDTAALQEALRTIDNEGIASVIGDAPADTTRH